MENQEWKLLKELPDVSVGSIGYQDGQYIRFDSDIKDMDSNYYEIDFVKTKTDWFEKVEPKDYNVFERLIKARDLISKERGKIKIILNNNGNLNIINDDNELKFNPFNFLTIDKLKMFVEENREDLIKFFNM